MTEKEINERCLVIVDKGDSSAKDKLEEILTLPAEIFLVQFYSAIYNFELGRHEEDKNKKNEYLEAALNSALKASEKEPNSLKLRHIVIISKYLMVCETKPQELFPVYVLCRDSLNLALDQLFELRPGNEVRVANLSVCTREILEAEKKIVEYCKQDDVQDRLMVAIEEISSIKEAQGLSYPRINRQKKTLGQLKNMKQKVSTAVGSVTQSIKEQTSRIDSYMKEIVSAQQIICSKIPDTESVRASVSCKIEKVQHSLEDMEKEKEQSLLSSIQDLIPIKAKVNLEAILTDELEVLLQGINEVYKNLILPATSLAQTLTDYSESGTNGTSILGVVKQKLEAIKIQVTNLIDSRRITQVDTVASSVLKLPGQEAHWASGKNSAPGFSEEGVTSTSSQRHFLEQIVTLLIKEGNFNAALWAALNEADDEVVLLICSKVPEELSLDPALTARLLKRLSRNLSLAKRVP